MWVIGTLLRGVAWSSWVRTDNVDPYESRVVSYSELETENFDVGWNTELSFLRVDVPWSSACLQLNAFSSSSVNRGGGTRRALHDGVVETRLGALMDLGLGCVPDRRRREHNAWMKRGSMIRKRHSVKITIPAMTSARMRKLLVVDRELAEVAFEVGLIGWRVGLEGAGEDEAGTRTIPGPTFGGAVMNVTIPVLTAAFQQSAKLFEGSI